MQKFMTVVILLCLGLGGDVAKSQSQLSRSTSAVAADLPSSSTSLPALPAAPQGKSTILGGRIRRVDPVRDQLLLDIYGQRPMKILYDERTQVFRDGVRVPLRDVGAEDRASIQTILDGTNVFALSIHILSHRAEGDCQGRVVSYDPQQNQVAIASNISPEPVRLRVAADTAIARVGEPEFMAAHSGVADLVPGTLVEATFASDTAGHDVAQRITVLAVPGAGFVFYGNITFLDLNSGLLVLVDPRDQRTYEIHLSPSRFPISKGLHSGENVTVAANYDGKQYMADSISINSSPTLK
jgi:hypothetical protein